MSHPQRKPEIKSRSHGPDRHHASDHDEDGDYESASDTQSPPPRARRERAARQPEPVRPHDIRRAPADGRGRSFHSFERIDSRDDLIENQQRRSASPPSLQLLRRAQAASSPRPSPEHGNPAIRPLARETSPTPSPEGNELGGRSPNTRGVVDIMLRMAGKKTIVPPAPPTVPATSSRVVSYVNSASRKRNEQPVAASSRDPHPPSHLSPSPAPRAWAADARLTRPPRPPVQYSAYQGWVYGSGPVPPTHMPALPPGYAHPGYQYLQFVPPPGGHPPGMYGPPPGPGYTAMYYPALPPPPFAAPHQQVPRVSADDGASPDGNYPCHFCARRFDRRADMTKHMLTHDSKPFKCPRCGRGFTCTSNVNRHERKCDSTPK